MKNILLVEDDQQITTLLNLHLNSPSHLLTSCGKGLEALNKIENNAFDLIILDIMLPDISGLSICKKLRDENNQTPIIMLTSRSDETDKVLALEMGADDYITKPFGVLELIARTKALLRRTSPAETEKLEILAIDYKSLHIDKVKRKVLLNGERLDLTLKEFDLLYLLASNPGKPFSRNELLEIVWGFAFQGYEHTVTAHINRL
ncbi:MAG TPA: response regulator transcription factor, partial [Nitrosopumilaceae archaeon]|nr:response regulator transcription factor [Nitrosopumilaceae archaeon]